MLKIQCALIRNDELIAIEVEVSPTASGHNLKEDIRANISPRLDHFDGTQTHAHQNLWRQTDDHVSQFRASRGASLTRDGLTFKVLSRSDKVSVFTAPLPSSLHHVSVLIPDDTTPSGVSTEPVHIAPNSRDESEMTVVAIYDSNNPPNLTGILKAVASNLALSRDCLRSRKLDGQLVNFPIDTKFRKLLPGRYYLIPNGWDDLKADGVGLPIKPTLRYKRKFDPSSPSSPSSTPKKSRVEVEGDDGESATSSDTDHDEELSQFRQKFIQRDSHCVVTREYSGVDVHVLARSWWQEPAKQRLPLAIIYGGFAAFGWSSDGGEPAVKIT
ncbi:hypothetical protein BJ741DRAFT_652160 [Chytriomyces cf. hyalinus JEL632]|nr:hypothetical protein BJ741DRAFT_652160 [Chytriomyces cf. hyalinus JEL632]